jgi:hypothetical protein
LDGVVARGYYSKRWNLNYLDYSVDPGFNQVRLTAKDYANVADLAQKLGDPFPIIQLLRLTLVK